MELGSYRQPIIDFQGPKSKGTSRGMYVEILVCSKCWKKSTSTTAFSPMPSIFQVNLVFLPTFFCPGTTFNSLNFQRTYLIAIIVWALFLSTFREVSKKKFSKYFCCFSKLYLKTSFEYYKASSILWEAVLKGIFNSA